MTANAKKDLQAAYRRAAKHAPDAAGRWLDRLEQALQTLSVDPQRCGLAPENDSVTPEIREFRFGKRPRVYRAFFTIEEDSVIVLHVRWGARDAATEDELFG